MNYMIKFQNTNTDSEKRLSSPNILKTEKWNHIELSVSEKQFHYI